MLESESIMAAVDEVIPPAKSKGKRRATASLPPPPSDTDTIPSETPGAAATPPTRPGAQTRQKRILPSRSRRGGPGVGSCDIDVMILETRKRRLENEPLIPASTKFLLSTNSALVPPLPESEDKEAGEENVALNEFAFGRYFDRPEVQRAYKEQQEIQTPEFTLLPEDASVGGRFRPRSEEEFADTSDAAYEKRHRKYETFEKRQRLREKEKLKHEHYKLKERIDQLRGMDYSAFLALPSTALAESSDPAYDNPEAASSGVFLSLADLPGAHVNGAAAYNEGERRRKEMLDVALALEERYKILLPPDRKWFEKKKEKAAKRESLGAVTEIDAHSQVEDDEAEVVHVPTPRKDVKVSPQKEMPVQVQQLVAQGHKQHSDGESEIDFEERDRLRSKQLKLRIKFRPRPTDSPTDTAKGSPSPSKKPSLPALRLSAPPPPSPSILDSISPAQVKNISSKDGIIIRSRDGKFLPKHRRYITDPPESISAPPVMTNDTPSIHPHTPRKRQRTESTIDRPSPVVSTKQQHVSYAGAAGRNERTTCVLMISATRQSLLPNSRKTQRHITAFGTRVPPEIEEVRDYEIPKWLHNPEEDGKDDGDEPALEHGSAYGYNASVNGVAYSASVEEGVEEADGAEEYMNGKDQDIDELMDWPSNGADHSLEMQDDDDMPPIATLDDV